MTILDTFEPKLVVNDPLTASALIAKDISYIKGDISEIKGSIKDMSHVFITREEFIPVRNIAYGLVGIVGLAIATALVKILFMK